MSGHWKENFDYRFAGAYELQPGEERPVKIKTVKNEEVQSLDGSKKLCLVAYFEGNNKPMILNKTNCKTIEKLYSPYIKDWSGKEITVFASKVKAFGETVDALRIRPTVPKKQTKDISSFETALRNCKTLDELKTVFTSAGFPQKELENIKNEIKLKLSK